MRFAQYTASLLTSFTLLALLSACGGGGKGRETVAENLIAVTTQCDAGAAINPTDIKVKKGDRPTFAITLQSGYSIQTIYCNTGGSLVGTQFTMAPVQAMDNVRVVTQNRWVGAAQMATASDVRAEGSLPVAEESSLGAVEATSCITAEKFTSSSMHVSAQSAKTGMKFTLRGKVGVKDIIVPLREGAPGVYESDFALRDHGLAEGVVDVPNMLHFSIICEDGGALSVHGMVFIPVQR